MSSKDQLRNVAPRCSQYRFVGGNTMKSESNVLGETVKSCENCQHFTSQHKCELNLIDEITSNMDVKLDD